MAGRHLSLPFSVHHHFFDVAPAVFGASALAAQYARIAVIGAIQKTRRVICGAGGSSMKQQRATKCFLDRQQGEDLPPLRCIGDTTARSLDGRELGDIGALDGDRSFPPLTRKIVTGVLFLRT